MAKKVKKQDIESEEDKKFPLPEYNKEEDIYNNAEEESLDDEGELIKQGDRRKQVGDDLDVPGSELDDEEEGVGEEDEENNYYSLGGDNHDDLEEDRD